MLKKKYRDKVRKRVESMVPVVEDQKRLKLAIQLAFFSDVEALSRKTSIPRREIRPGEPVPDQEIHNFAEHLRMLVMSDIPALLNELDEVSDQEPPGKGGYINRHGVRVPNPCGEIDMKGRDMDRVCRNIRPGQKWDDETIDAILNNPENI